MTAITWSPDFQDSGLPRDPNQARKCGRASLASTALDLQEKYSSCGVANNPEWTWAGSSRCGSAFSQHHLLKRLSLPYGELFLVPFSKQVALQLKAVGCFPGPPPVSWMNLWTRQTHTSKKIPVIFLFIHSENYFWTNQEVIW